jgi:hypothetical protein
MVPPTGKPLAGDGDPFGTRSAGLGQVANGVGKMICLLNLGLFADASNIVAPQAALVVILLADRFLVFRMLPLGPSFVFGTEVRRVPSKRLTRNPTRPDRRLQKTAFETDNGRSAFAAGPGLKGEPSRCSAAPCGKDNAAALLVDY